MVITETHYLKTNNKRSKIISDFRKANKDLGYTITKISIKKLKGRKNTHRISYAYRKRKK